MLWCNIFYKGNGFVLGQVSFPSKSLEKGSGRSKDFDVDVACGPNVKGTPTIASRR